MVKLYLHWRRLRDNAGDSDSHYLLALATLGSMTQTETILSVSRHPRWPRQVRPWHKIADDFANKLANVNNPLEKTFCPE